MFIPFFINRNKERQCSCNCAEKVIEYLENEKYTWIPKDMSIEEREKLHEEYKKIYEQIPKNSESILAMQRILKETFFTKVERSSIKQNDKKM